MLSEPTTLRPTPRWVHAWAVLTVALTAVLLALGSVVTSFRVGMSDPVWPTEPWYLLVNGFAEPRSGFLVEHVHRVFGFAVGAAVSVLAIGLWLTEPRPRAKWLGLAGLVALLAAFGQFHRTMMTFRDPEAVIVWPTNQIALMGGLLALLLAVAASGVSARLAGGWPRLLGVLCLVGVMVQGLLGGLRVRLDAILGTDLAAVHGVFAQVVFTGLVVAAVLTAKRRQADVPADERKRLTPWSHALLTFTLLQLVWGAAVRHHGTPVMQRLHFLTAFVVLGSAVYLVRSASAGPGWRRLGLTGKLLLGVIAFQILLGVEAWMGKFYLTLTPDLDRVTTGKALVRCLHVLTGTAVLALTAVFAVVLGQRSVTVYPFAGVGAGRGDHAAVAVGGRT